MVYCLLESIMNIRDNNLIRTLKLAILLPICFFFTNAQALGPIDGEVGLYWWQNDFDADISEGEIDAGALGGRGELWFDQKWGVSAQLYRSDLEEDNLDDAEYLNIDFKRRIFSLTDNSFLALGLGYQDVNIDNDSSNGARILVEGRVGLGGVVYLYGQTAWFPELEDFSNRSNVDGTEFEAGLSFDPLPFLSVRAGYRKFKIDYTNELNNDDESAKSTGFVIGAGLHW